MKKKYVFPCLMALSVATGCIKEQGEEQFLITRDDIKEYDENAKGTKKINRDSVAYTLVTSVGGFAVGEAKIDVLDTNTFRVFLSGAKRITDLDCYVELSSKFENLELNGKAFRELGCVYSHTNKFPVVDGAVCATSDSKYVVEKTKSDTEVSFKSGCHNLDFNSDYYVRSYAVLEDEDGEPCDTIYNQRVMKIHTTLPEDVWVQRNDVGFGSRYEAVSCAVGEKIYLYGGKSGSTYFNDMWIYNKDNDSWSQGSTFELGSVPYYAGTEQRANGAAFAFPTQQGDVLIYILGGEIEGKKPTEKVIFYSTKNGRYCQQADHPNYNDKEQIYINGVPQYEKKQKLDETGQPLYDITGEPIMEDDKTKPMVGTVGRAYVEDLPMAICGNAAFVVNTSGGARYYVGFGKNEKNALVSSFYEYNLEYDKTNTRYPNYHTLTWSQAGSTAGDKGRGEALYQPVCEVCGSRIIVGTGESSKGGLSKTFYQITVDEVGEVTMSALPGTPEEFKPRANAASFYLTFEKNGDPHERFYVGTGRTFLEGSSGELLNDFWYYDFSQEKWGQARDFSNSTYYREGATGFATSRKDDFDKEVSGLIKEEARGIFTLGYGHHQDDGTKVYFKDTWEYLP